MKIGLIGYGVVGKAAENTLKKKYEIIKYDKYQDLGLFSNLKACDFTFIMVPTPFDCEKNEVDDSAILESLNKLEKIDYKNVVIIKSTIPPGSCLKYLNNYNLDIVFNPEFLTEANFIDDFKNQNRIIIGGEDRNSILTKLYSNVY